MCALIETLLQHPRATQLTQSSPPSAAAPAGEMGKEGNASGHPPGTPKLGGAREELQVAVHEVAAAQRTAELTEWLGCAKIALQARTHHALCPVHPCALTLQPINVLHVLGRPPRGKILAALTCNSSAAAPCRLPRRTWYYNNNRNGLGCDGQKA